MTPWPPNRRESYIRRAIDTWTNCPPDPTRRQKWGAFFAFFGLVFGSMTVPQIVIAALGL